MYLVVYKLRDLKLITLKFGDKSSAVKKYKALWNSKPKPISISMYHERRVINWDGLGSHFNKKS